MVTLSGLYQIHSSSPRVILGVTNPFFIKALDHWPHILKVGDTVEGAETPERQEKTRLVHVISFGMVKITLANLGRIGMVELLTRNLVYTLSTNLI